MSRSQSREEAFKLLYSMKFLNDSDANEQIELFIETDEIKLSNQYQRLITVLVLLNSVDDRHIAPLF